MNKIKELIANVFGWCGVAFITWLLYVYAPFICYVCLFLGLALYLYV